MNVLFDINHPGHVHFFKNAIQILKTQGHAVTVTARDKEVAVELLENYNIEHQTLSKANRGFLGLAVELLSRELQLISIFKKNKIDICASVTGAATVHVSTLFGKPSLVFYDTEHAKIQNSITNPFATQYITPDCYLGERRKNQVTYTGVHELAYLHPNYFTPDKSIFSLLKIKEDSKFSIIRFVAWGASHDVGQKGISLELKRKLITELSSQGHVFIVSESTLDAEFEPYRLVIQPEKIHDVLFYASLFIGEGATMASECACLGTPAIYVNSLKLGYITEEEKYGLVYDLENEEEILAKVKEIIRAENKDEWQNQKNKFLANKIDVTQFIVNSILKYEQK